MIRSQLDEDFGGSKKKKKKTKLKPEYAENEVGYFSV